MWLTNLKPKTLHRGFSENMVCLRSTLSRDKAVSQRSAGTAMDQDGDQAVASSDPCRSWIPGYVQESLQNPLCIVDIEAECNISIRIVIFSAPVEEHDCMMS